MYCHNFHVVLSDGDFFSLDYLCHVHGSSLTWWPCLPIPFLFFTGTCSSIWGCVLLFSCLSLGFLLCRRVIFVTCRDRESWWWFFCSHTFLFWLEHTMYCLRVMMRLFTNDGCGDYHQVWCVSFFSKTSILVVSFGLHQLIKLVDLISM